MGFWIFMLIMELLIPFTMIGFGKRWMSNPPEEINEVHGYRTPMSMLNKDTWVFAHKIYGTIWIICGLVLLPISVVVMVLVLGEPKSVIETVGIFLCFFQMFFLAVPVFPTEMALRKKFDEDGNKR